MNVVRFCLCAVKAFLVDKNALCFVDGHFTFPLLVLNCQTVGTRSGEAAGGVQVFRELFVVNSWDRLNNIFVSVVML
jgi:hypothetical protein